MVWKKGKKFGVVERDEKWESITEMEDKGTPTSFWYSFWRDEETDGVNG